jgi:hypothetical protein
MRSEGDLKKRCDVIYERPIFKIERNSVFTPSFEEFEVVNFKLRCFLVEKKREKSRILEILSKCLSFLNLLFEFARFSS